MRITLQNFTKLFFLLVVFKNYGQQDLLSNKIWDIQAYYSIIFNEKVDYFDINSDTNLVQLEGASYFFLDEEVYLESVNRTVNFAGNWSLNVAQDSIQLDQVKFRIISLDAENFILSSSRYDYGSTPENSIPITSFLEMKPAIFEDITLSNNDFSNDKELEGVTLYPIPVKSDLNIRLLDKELNIKKVTFYTLTGEEVFSKTFKDEIDDRILDVSALNTGVYFVRFYDKENTNLGVKKIIKI